MEDKRSALSPSEWRVMECLWAGPKTLMEPGPEGQRGLGQEHRQHHGAADEGKRTHRL